MSKKQNSIDWIFSNLPLIQQEGLRDVFEQAKEMHKEEITSAHLCGQNSNEDIEDQQTEIEYYNATFGG
jgi:hypothetical protein